MKTFDQRTLDSTGAFLIGQLEQLDRTMHMPLQSFTWSRDINVRSDVGMGDDFSSFTNMAMAGTGGLDPAAKAFVGKSTTNLPSVAIDIGKTPSPLIPWGMELGYTVFELESAIKIGQSVDEAKHTALRTKYQQDADIMVYLGDTTIPNAYGLWNSPQVTNVADVVNGTSGFKPWTSKTPDEILADVNELLYSVWAATAFTHCPRKLALPPQQFAYLVSQKVSSAGNLSILQFLKDNSISLAQNGVPLEIVPQKWLTGTAFGGFGPASGGKNRMVAYTQQYDLVRFPMVPMMSLPLQLKGIYQLVPYISKFGLVEFVYPETIAYRDGI